MRVPTADDDLYFKANAPPHRFEAALVEVLTQLLPGQVPELPAVDPDRGWMLMRDGGTRLRELVRSPADLARWEELLPIYASSSSRWRPMSTKCSDSACLTRASRGSRRVSSSSWQMTKLSCSTGRTD
jgi:hypothetical protein